METLLTSLLVLVAYTLGLIIGQRIKKNEPIIPDPIKAIEKHKVIKEQKKEVDKMQDLLSKIDNFEAK